MKLDEWMTKHGKNDRVVSEETGWPIQAVGYYRRGERIPRPARMAQLVAYTRGAVRPTDFYDAATDFALSPAVVDAQ